MDLFIRKWGGVWDGAVLAVSDFLKEEHEGIFTKELNVNTVIFFLKGFEGFYRVQDVMLISYSMVIVQVVRNLTSRSSRTM